MTGTTRQNIFKLKRSNVSGKIPTTSDLLVGELAINTQDGFLYTSIANTGGTNTVEVRQIGWDRLSILSGGTVNGNVIVNGSLSATTYLGLPIDPNTYVTGFTYNNANKLTISQNGGQPDLNVFINTMSGLSITGNISVTGTSDLQGNFLSSIIPNTNRSLSLGDGTHFWQSLWTQYIRVGDNSGNDVILISAPPLASSPDPSWSLVLPAQTGETFSMLGIHSAGDNTVNTTWFNFSGGNNVTITKVGNSSGGTLTFSSQDNYVTGGTYSNGTLTLNRQNGSVVVTGFSTGGTSVNTFVTGFTHSDGLLTISQNNGVLPLTADTTQTRLISFHSNDMTLNTASRTTLSPLIMSVTRFAGTGAVDDAGLTFIVPQDYLNTPEFYFTWRAATTSANSAKIFLDMYTGDTSNAGSLTTIVETVSMTGTPVTVNAFLYSSTTTPTTPIKSNDSIHLRIYRDPGNAGDTYTGNLDMINLIFRYKSKG